MFDLSESYRKGISLVNTVKRLHPAGVRRLLKYSGYKLSDLHTSISNGKWAVYKRQITPPDNFDLAIYDGDKRVISWPRFFGDYNDAIFWVRMVAFQLGIYNGNYVSTSDLLNIHSNNIDIALGMFGVFEYSRDHDINGDVLAIELRLDRHTTFLEHSSFNAFAVSLTPRNQNRFLCGMPYFTSFDEPPPQAHFYMGDGIESKKISRGFYKWLGPRSYPVDMMGWAWRNYLIALGCSEHLGSIWISPAGKRVKVCYDPDFGYYPKFIDVELGDKRRGDIEEDEILSPV